MARRNRGFSLKWNGPDIERGCVNKLNLALAEIGQMVVVEAQRELYPGHGYRSGTLHDSLYYRVTRQGRVSTLTVGSPLVYAIYVHEGHGSFGGYQYIAIGAERVRPYIPAILERYRL